MSRWITFLIACVGLGHGVAWGHIIPPEKLHPVAESYRRTTFILNLNPVVWEQVSPEVDAIANYWRGIDPDASRAFFAGTSALRIRISKCEVVSHQRC